MFSCLAKDNAKDLPSCNDFEIIINGQNNLVDLDMVFTPFATFQPLWTPNPIDEFMERLWAFKRIKYLLGK